MAKPIRKKSVRIDSAARKIGMLYLPKKSDAELIHTLETIVGWRLIDSVNLGRIADALEGIAAGVLDKSKGVKL